MARNVPRCKSGNCQTSTLPQEWQLPDITSLQAWQLPEPYLAATVAISRNVPRRKSSNCQKRTSRNSCSCHKRTSRQEWQLPRGTVLAIAILAARNVSGNCHSFWRETDLAARVAIAINVPCHKSGYCQKRTLPKEWQLPEKYLAISLANARNVPRQKSGICQKRTSPLECLAIATIVARYVSDNCHSCGEVSFTPKK